MGGMQHNMSCSEEEQTSGNTGFYYLSGSRKKEKIRSLYLSILDQSRLQPYYDDQTLFWLIMLSIRNGDLYEQWSLNSNNGSKTERRYRRGTSMIYSNNNMQSQFG